MQQHLYQMYVSELHPEYLTRDREGPTPVTRTHQRNVHRSTEVREVDSPAVFFAPAATTPTNPSTWLMANWTPKQVAPNTAGMIVFIAACDVWCEA